VSRVSGPTPPGPERYDERSGLRREPLVKVAVDDLDLREGDNAPDGEEPRVGRFDRVMSREVLRLEKASEVVRDFRLALGKYPRFWRGNRTISMGD
jgi:hypothetical protein